MATLVFLGLGFGLDRWLGTEPVFMIVLVLLALIGQFARMYYEYDITMRAHEQQRSDAVHAAGRGNTR